MNTIKRHIEQLKKVGECRTAFLLTGKVHRARLANNFNTRLSRSPLKDESYHTAWWTTKEGVVLCYSGSEALCSFAEKFVGDIPALQIAEDAQCVYVGYSVDSFNQGVMPLLAKFTQAGNNRNSFGGKQIKPE
ncbi:hypothetical protein [Pseudomonas sp. p1(2021b)]|uniref:hypothetical protein n=1 Tax=Pseudomonas sp. p1(2021b) TaxID=2874628 RepID=UPI003D2BC616